MADSYDERSVQSYLVWQSICSKIPQSKLESPVFAVIQGELNSYGCICRWCRVDGGHGQFLLTFERMLITNDEAGVSGVAHLRKKESTFVQ